PKDRLQRLVNQTFLDEDGEGAQDLRFVFGIHGEIGMFPIAENAEALELLALNIDKFARESFATLADLEWGEVARFLYHLVFDGKPMAVPTRHVRRTFAEHGLGL